jgi:hypothetical protein
MNLKAGEIWACKESCCKAEIEVRKSAEETCHGKFTVRCCCGKDMYLKQPAKPLELPVAVGSRAVSRA